MKNKKSGFTPLEINSTRNLVSKKIAKANGSIKISPFTCGRPPLKQWRTNLSLAGFTLLELLTVVAIISLLAAMVFPNLGKVRTRARIAKVISELKTIELALMEYYAEHSGFPTNDTLPANPEKSGLYKLFEEDLLDTALEDPFKSSGSYDYYAPNNNGDIADSCIVFSVGIDGQNNAVTDIGSAITDAYFSTGEPGSDNIYLIIDPPAGNEGDIRYKK